MYVNVNNICFYLIVYYSIIISHKSCVHKMKVIVENSTQVLELLNEHS